MQPTIKSELKPIFDDSTAIVFCCDNIYAPYLFVCLESMYSISKWSKKVVYETS